LPAPKKIGIILLWGYMTLAPRAFAGGGPGQAQAWPGMPGYSGDSLIHQLILRLDAQQIKTDGFYYQGTFPTLRAWAATPFTLKADNSIFYTGLVIWTLRRLEPRLQGEDKILCDSIIARGIRSYVHYRNRRGGPSYNFWPTDKPVFFPQSLVLDRFKDSKQIADDMDDTGILYLGKGWEPGDTAVAQLKTLMDAFACGSRGPDGKPRKALNTYKQFRNLPAYSSWLGAKTPVEFDAGVFCNMMMFVLTSGLPLDLHDTATIQFLQFVLRSKAYLNDPAFASPYYSTRAVLMYHYGRLLDKFPLDSLKSLAPQLREDARKLMETTPNSMDRVVLGTTLIRLGDTTGEQTLSGTMTADWAERQRYKFYIANISSLFPHWIRRMFLHSPLCIYRFYCPAYNDTLLLEYLVLSNNKRYNN
jgi:hypothetical protein